MIEQFLKLYSFIIPILIKHPLALSLLNASELQIASEIISVLKPIKMVSKKLCGEHYVTSSSDSND